MEQNKTKLGSRGQQCPDEETLHQLFSKRYVYSRNSQWSLKSTSIFDPFITSCTTQQDDISTSCAKQPDKVSTSSVKHQDKISNSCAKQQDKVSASCAEQQDKVSASCRKQQDSISASCAEQQDKISTSCTKQQDDTSHFIYESTASDCTDSTGSPACSEEIAETKTTEERVPDCGLVLHEKGGRGRSGTPEGSNQSVIPPPGQDDSTQQNPQLKSPHFCQGRHAPPNKFRRKAASSEQRLKRVKVSLPASWRCECLTAEKDKLNALKDRLSDKDMIVWHQHTSSTNLAGKVVGEVKNHYKAELCTQAWCKFHEILSSCAVIPPSVLAPNQGRLNTVHLCEAPGAFITSLNHYLVSRGFDTRHNWRWLGTTLNPYYEGNDTGRMISDDRFIRLTFRNWFFGSNNSGDLMCDDNMLALMEHVQRMGDIHLITADGSIDCQENPAEQEVIVSRLHHCEVLCSCLLLAPGGTLVIKLFTMFEASSIALLYFLNCVFEKVTVCKPATSKSGNSEVYTVCSGYTAPLSRDGLFSLFSAVCASEGPHNVLSKNFQYLLAASEDPHIVLLPREDIPDDFLADHVSCCLYFCRLQSETIARNLRLFGGVKEEERKRTDRLQDLCVEHYVALCELKEIEDVDRIKPRSFRSNFSRFNSCRGYNKQSSRPTHGGAGVDGVAAVIGIGSSAVSLPAHRLQGTFQQRQQQNQSSWQELLGQMQYEVWEDSYSAAIKRHQTPSGEEMKGWAVMVGRGFGAVASSQFCDSRILADLLLMLQHAQVRLHQQKAWSQHSAITLSNAFNLLLSATLHHHPTITNNLYHLPLEGSVTSFWPAGSPELSTTCMHHRLSATAELRKLEEGGEVGVVVDVTCPELKEREEVECQTRLLDVLLHVCSYLPSGSTVVVIMPVVLTRLTAGLLYLFAGLFQQTSFTTSGQSMFLYHTLCFHNFSYPSYTLLRLLETLRHTFSSLHDPCPTRRLTFVEDASHGSFHFPRNGEDSCVASRSGDSKGVLPCDKVRGSEGSGSVENGSHYGVGRTDKLHRGEESVSGGKSGEASNATPPEATVAMDTDAVVDRRMSGDSKEVGDDESAVLHSDVKVNRMSHDGEVTLHNHSESHNMITDEQEQSCGGQKQSLFKQAEHNSATRSLCSNTKEVSQQIHRNITSPAKEKEELHCSVAATIAESTGLGTKRSRLPSDDSRFVSTGDANSSSSELRCGGGGGGGDSATNDAFDWEAEDRAEGRVKGQMPLELVPVLEIVNDQTFTRFLQSCNRQSITRFLATMKSAEHRHLSGQK